jgi:iron(III) transport system ATP-binding protein
MIEGAVVQVAPPEELYHAPATPEVARFVGEANFLKGRVENGCIRCLLGEVPTSCPWNGEAEAMLRPESLRLTADPEGEATVIGREFYGHDQLVKLRFPSGVVLCSRLGGGPGFKIGERVSIEVAGRAVVFPK